MTAGKHPGEPGGGTGATDLTQRVAGYCEQLGITLDELARRAGMAPNYLRQVEEMGIDFDADGVRRLASALDVPYEELMGGRTDPPGGQAPPAPHPGLAKMTTDECWACLGHHGIGRIALPAGEGTDVLPVNYFVDGKDIIYRTARGRAADPRPGGPDITFEADHMSEEHRDGWSVLVFGRAEHLTDPEVIGRYGHRPGAEPWAGGLRDRWVRIVPNRLTGRRIHTSD